MKGDFIVTTNAGRAIYIVYSFFMIFVITTFILLLYETFFKCVTKDVALHWEREYKNIGINLEEMDLAEGQSRNLATGD